MKTELSIKPPYQILNLGGTTRLGTPVLVIADMTEECYPFGNVPGHYRDVAEFMVRASNAHDDLVEALEGVLAGFDAQVFVRNTDGDGDPSWALKLIPHIKALAAAQAALARARGEASDAGRS